MECIITEWHIPCLCVLSASAFIDSSLLTLHQLDFFLEIFLWRLVIIIVRKKNLCDVLAMHGCHKYCDVL